MSREAVAAKLENVVIAVLDQLVQNAELVGSVPDSATVEAPSTSSQSSPDADDYPVQSATPRRVVIRMAGRG